MDTLLEVFEPQEAAADHRIHVVHHSGVSAGHVVASEHLSIVVDEDVDLALGVGLIQRIAWLITRKDSQEFLIERRHHGAHELSSPERHSCGEVVNHKGDVLDTAFQLPTADSVEESKDPIKATGTAKIVDNCANVLDAAEMALSVRAILADLGGIVDMVELVWHFEVILHFIRSHI